MILLFYCWHKIFLRRSQDYKDISWGSSSTISLYTVLLNFVFQISLYIIFSAESKLSNNVNNNNTTSQTISPNHIQTFFEENNTKMLRFQHDIEDLSSQLVKERTIVSDLNGTIDGLKEELEKAQGNISNISTLKDALESQQQRTNETLRIQVSKLIF